MVEMSPENNKSVKPIKDKIVFRENFTEPFSKTIFLVCTISLNFAMMFFALYNFVRGVEGIWYTSQYFFISGILLGILHSIFFSKSTFQKIINPIIWIIIFSICSFICSFWADVLHSWHPVDWFTFIGFILGFGQSLIFFRNTNVGFWPALSNPFGMLVAVSVICDFGLRCQRRSIEYFINAGLIFAVISAMPFIYFLFYPRQREQ